ncbi:MAG TPA: isoprenylcysteine carboxylmethyltransferase family protein [Anaerolineae bacterium]|nr:isoprenylcysteine carboxylmethyltransferase family protein [Anaerolineae bacterium]
MDQHLIGYIVGYLGYRIAENWAMAKAGTLAKRPQFEWTMALIVVPYYLTAAAPLLEYLIWQTQPTAITWVLGGLGFLAAAFFRVRAHLDLQKGFSMAIEHGEEHQLVKTGLYARIRHPLYLGNLFLFIACPLFLAARVSWLFTALGLIGIVIRIKIEEKFLTATFPDYAEYMHTTHALIPGVF